MSTNNNGRNGLRILWIPGRKKHQRKGRYDTTSKNVKPLHTQKKNEPWSLGGNYGQAQLLKSDAVIGVTSLPTAISVLPAAIPAAGVADTVLHIQGADESKKDQPPLVDACENPENCDTSNMATLAIGDIVRKKFDKENSFDSIEKFADDTISVANSNISDYTKQNGSVKKKKNRKSKKRKNKKDKELVEGLEQDNDPTVKCLYWTLMCCECSIS